MAAYAALVSLMNDLELIPNHPTHSFSFDERQISSLSQTVNFLVDFLESYDSSGCSREVAENWEGQIASAAHAAHHVIETHIVDQIHSRSIFRKTRSSFLSDLQKAIDNMDIVKEKANHFQAKGGLEAAEQPTYSALTSGKNLVERSDDDVLIRLTDILTRGPSNERVISIVGMGGIGKTTLTKKAFEDSHIAYYFDLRLWATLSQHCSVINILEQLLSEKTISTAQNDGESGEQNDNRPEKDEDRLMEEFDKKKVNQLRKDKVGELGQELHQMLFGRRCLIVLDNMWSVTAWDEIRIYLSGLGDESRVIVTTRLSNLATHLSHSPFEMNFLNEDKSWQLFCENAFGGGGEEGGVEDCPIGLEKIGKRIARRCGGLPLSIVVIGGHLRKSSRNIEYWEKVANYLNPISSSVADEQCLNILSLSYQYLPVCLKPCFMYMGVFQEGELICASKILQLWVAEGFLREKKGLSLEKVGENHLEDLVDRNLIMVHERTWNGRVKICALHDNVRELCLKVGKEEKFMCALEDTAQAIEMERRVVILKREHHHPYHVATALQSAPLLRSLVCHGEQLLQVGQLLTSFRLLRLSDYVIAYGVNDDDDCSPPTDLQHVNLRHLAFSFQRNSERLLKLPLELYFQSTSNERSLNLPSSIFLFWNLQSLTLKNYDGQITLPYEIWEISQLRHLELFGICLPDPVPTERRVILENLQTLEGVENLRLTREVCKRMPNIKNLSMRYVINIYNRDFEADMYYFPHNLGRFNGLRSLKYELVHLFLSFTFPTSLEELSLVDPYLRWNDLALRIKPLPYLGSLDLDSVQGYEWDLVDEEYPHLKTLRISSCKDFTSWKADSSNFPALELLNISHVPELNEIPLDIGEIPTLRRIQLRGCSESAAASAKEILAEQESLGNEDLQLDIVATLRSV